MASRRVVGTRWRPGYTTAWAETSSEWNPSGPMRKPPPGIQRIAGRDANGDAGSSLPANISLSQFCTMSGSWYPSRLLRTTLELTEAMQYPQPAAVHRQRSRRWGAQRDQWRRAEPDVCTARSGSVSDCPLLLLCRKTLDRFGADLSGMEILTRGGGLWVSNPAQAAANHGSPPMSRRSRRRSAMPIARRLSDPIARDFCCRAIARASSRWPRACSRDACRQHTSRCTTSWRSPIGPTRRCSGRCVPGAAHHLGRGPSPLLIPHDGLIARYEVKKFRRDDVSAASADAPCGDRRSSRQCCGRPPAWRRDARRARPCGTG